jgi:hypothetical protein
MRTQTDQSSDDRSFIEPIGTRWIKSIWKDFKPILLIILGSCTLLLGTIGFQQNELSIGHAPQWIDSFYRSFTLFGFGAGNLSSPIPWQLDIARWSGPFATIFTAFLGVFSLFHQQMQLLGLRLGSRHVIVCGLGRTGFQLARSLRKSGKRVVVIEKNALNPQVEICRDIGVVVIPGDARDRFTLEKAGFLRANHLIALCGDDSANLEILVQARSLAFSRREILNLTAHIDDLQLYSLAILQEFPNQTGGVRFEFFNISDSWAMAALRSFPITGCESPNLLLIGMNEITERLILQVARQWSLASKQKSLKITVADEHGEEKVAALCRNNSLVSATCQFSFMEYSSTTLDFQPEQFFKMHNSNPFSHCYVCLKESGLALNAGLSMSNLLSNHKLHFIIRLNGEPGLAKMLKVIRLEGKGFFHLLDCLDNIYTQDLIELGNSELLARVIHEEYVKEQIRLLKDAKSQISLLPWEQLPEEYKIANRHQADRIGAKVAAIGCAVIPWVHLNAEQFSFTPEEIEKLARLEHERWCAERKSHGWRFNPRRDDKKKLHPSLIPWDDARFSESEKQKDRDTILRIPRYLALAGFEITRIQ